MASRNYYITTDPAFAEFVNYKMRLATPEQKARLNPRELAFFRSEKGTRSFAENETLERRILMLTRLGMQWTMVLHTEEADLQSLTAAVGKDYPYAKKAMDVVAGIKRGDQFIFGSRDVTTTMHLATMHSHSQMYVLDYSILKLRRLGRRGAEPDSTHVKMKEAEVAYDEIAQFMFQTIMAFRQASSIVDITDLQLRILLFLLAFKSQFVTVATIIGKMGEPQRNIGIKQTLMDMDKADLVTRMKVPAQGNNAAYTISAKGIDIVMTFIKYVNKKALFEPA